MPARSRSKLSLIRYVLDAGLGAIRHYVGETGTVVELGSGSSHGQCHGGSDTHKNAVIESHNKRSFLESPKSRARIGWNGQDRMACRQRGLGKTGAAATPGGGLMWG